MHRTHLKQLIRDTDIAFAIRPVIDHGQLTAAETRDALISLHVPRAAEIANLITSR